MKTAWLPALLAAACASSSAPSPPPGTLGPAESSPTPTAPPATEACTTQLLHARPGPAAGPLIARRGVLIHEPTQPSFDTFPPAFVVGGASVGLPATPEVLAYAGHYVEVTGREVSEDVGLGLAAQFLGYTVALCGDDHL